MYSSIWARSHDDEVLFITCITYKPTLPIFIIIIIFYFIKREFLIHVLFITVYLVKESICIQNGCQPNQF